MKTIKDGVWPTMVTPFTADREIDYKALEALIEWYIARGVSGLFAVCQSSEMFFLSRKERVELAKACVRFAKGRVEVIASGHVAETLKDQAEEAKEMADTGVAAVVLISNRFARAGEDTSRFKGNLEKFLSMVSADIPLGFYECPYPYKKVLTADETKFCVGTGRFAFLKDTSCTMASMGPKLEILKGTAFKLFNANAATLLETLRRGAAGYSGVMTNFHADLYSWLCANWKAKPQLAEELQDYLSVASVIERQLYPINAMYSLSKEGLPVGLSSRRVDNREFGESMRKEMDSFWNLSQAWSRRFKNL